MDGDTRTARLLNARLIKERIQALGCAIVGVGMIVLGIFQLGDTDVTCGSQVMEQGEVCEETKDGEVTAERDLEQQADDNTLTGWLITGGGVAMVIGSTCWAVSGFARKKRVTPDDVAAGLTPSTVHKARKAAHQDVPQHQQPQYAQGQHPELQYPELQYPPPAYPPQHAQYPQSQYPQSQHPQYQHPESQYPQQPRNAGQQPPPPPNRTYH